MHDSPAFRALLQGDVAKRMATVRPSKLLPFRLVAGWAGAAVVVIALTAAAAATGGPRVLHLLHRAALPGANLARVSRVQVEILEPSPPSRTLPAGDTVALVVAVRGLGPLEGGLNEVTLETQSPSDEQSALRPMRPVTGDAGENAADGSAGVRAGETRWAVNLTLGEEDVTYRILAGDAVTRRYTLSVRPRPRITTFTKTVVFPEYAGLDPQTVSEAHGDLFALAGSTVTLTLEPNQPVSAAELRLSPADPDAAVRSLPLIAAEGDDGVVRWTAAVPMDAPATLRVHLVGAETGFDNPFAPRSEIRPLADAPPTVAFTRLPEGAAAGLLLPPDDLLDLAASAADDLPLDRFEQLTSVNGGEWTATPLPFELVPDAEAGRTATGAATNSLMGDAGGRTLAATWRWDLLPMKLKTGDEVRTKLIAVDRNGQIGESPTLRVLIAGEDFDPLRHLAAERKIALVDAFAALKATLEEQKELAYAALERVKQAPDDAAATAEEYATLRDLRGRRRDAAAALVSTVAAALPGQPSGADALELELLGRLVSEIGLTPAADPVEQAARGESTDAIRDAARRDFDSAAGDAGAAETFARRFATHNFLAALAADMAAVHRQQSRIVDTPEMTWDRLARQEAVVRGRLEAVEEFARRHRDRLTDGVQREVDSLLKASGELRSKLAVAVAKPGDGKPTDSDLNAFRDAAREVRDDLNWRHKPNTLQNLASELKNTLKDLWNRTGDLPDRIGEAAGTVARLEELAVKRAAAEDSAEIDKLRAERGQVAADPRGDLAPAVDRLRDVRALQKARADADTVFAADAGLAARAVSAVADAVLAQPPVLDDPSAGDEPPAGGDDAAGTASALPDGVAASFALKEIAGAWNVLQAGHEVSAARRSAESLRERERWGAQSPAGRFDHPRQWDAHEMQLEYAVERLRRANAAGEGNRIEHALNEARWSPAAQRAKPLIVDRRWKDAGPVAADAELAQYAAKLRVVEADLAPTLAEARAVLAKYAPTIPELARAAAEAAREREDAAEAAAEAIEAEAAAADAAAEAAAAEAAADDPAAPQEAAEAAADAVEAAREQSREAVRELAREQAAAERDLAELADALADDADRQDLSDDAERNRAKDADAAVAAVEAPVEAAEDALADAARAAANDAATPEDRTEPLADAAEQQAATAEVLDLVADHFEKLDAGATEEELAETREALQALAAEAGAAEALAERFAPSEALAEAAAGDPQALLEQLEAELAVNPAMREALSDIAADAAADVQNVLEESVEQERDVQADLDRSDEAFQQKKDAVAEDLRDLAKAAERLKERAAETAEKAVDRDRAPEARESLQEARAALAEAVEATKDATANAPLPELAAAADKAGKALEKAAAALAKAEEQAGERTDAEVHKSDREREDRRQGLERDRDRLREAQERDARENQRQAESAQKKADAALRKAEKEAREAEKDARDAESDAKKAAESAAKEPEDAGRAQKAAEAEAKVAEAQADVTEAQADKAAAEQARDAAKKAAEAAKQATDAAGKQPKPKLDAANPGAQLAEQLAGEAEKDAEALKAKAADIAAAADFAGELNASEAELKRSEERQAGVTERVAAAAADLERAARHEERLGEPANAEALKQAADAIAELAEGESKAAEGKLADAADQAKAAAGDPNAGEPTAGDPNAGEAKPADPNADVAARDAVAAAEAALAGEAQALAATLAPPPVPGEATAPGEAGAAPPAGAPPAAGEAGAPGEAPAGSPPAGSPQAGAPPAGSPPGGTPPTPPRERVSPEEQARRAGSRSAVGRDRPGDERPAGSGRRRSGRSRGDRRRHPRGPEPDGRRRGTVRGGGGGSIGRGLRGPGGSERPAGPRDGAAGDARQRPAGRTGVRHGGRDGRRRGLRRSGPTRRAAGRNHRRRLGKSSSQGRGGRLRRSHRGGLRGVPRQRERLLPRPRRTRPPPARQRGEPMTRPPLIAMAVAVLAAFGWCGPPSVLAQDAPPAVPGAPPLAPPAAGPLDLGEPAAGEDDPQVDAAMERAVAYLLSQQKEDGSVTDKGHPTAMTALAVMALASVGTTPSDPTPEGTTMRQALDFVLREDRVEEDGYFGRKDGSRMYGHGIITLMLSEMLGMGADEAQDRLIRAVRKGDPGDPRRPEPAQGSPQQRRLAVRTQQ